MKFAYWMLLAAALLPYITVGAAKARMNVDNSRPRADVAKLRGWQQRAEWAHRNHLEAFPAFAAALIVAMLAQVRSDWINIAAGLFVAVRIAYTLAYVADRPSLRSALWGGGLLIVIALFVAAAIR